MNDVVDFAALTALIVEDHPESALLLDAVLAESGMRLVPVRTAEEARAVVQTLRPDIILCDLALPGEDGLAFVRWVRATQGDGPDAIPAVAMTAFYERYGTREVRDAGFDVVLHKPIEPEHLVHTIGLLLEGRRGGGPAKT
jgi:CheY-like chemotaxis protein